MNAGVKAAICVRKSVLTEFSRKERDPVHAATSSRFWTILRDVQTAVCRSYMVANSAGCVR